MEEADLVLHTDAGASILAVADGHASVSIAPGMVLGARESANVAIEAVREHACKVYSEPSSVFARANELIRENVRLDLPGVAVFQPANPERDSTCSLTMRGRPQPPPFHGTTLTTIALLSRFRAILSFVGDSQALFVPRRGPPQWLHMPHDNSNAAEHERVTALGVKPAAREPLAKTHRHRYHYATGGGHSFKCSLTRTLGSFGVVPLLPTPEVVDLTLERGVVMLATGGFWELIDVETISRACATAATAQDICDICMAKCLERPSRGNCTVTCAILDENADVGVDGPTTNISSAANESGDAEAAVDAVVLTGVGDAPPPTFVASAEPEDVERVERVEQVEQVEGAAKAEVAVVGTACRVTCSVM